VVCAALAAPDRTELSTRQLSHCDEVLELHAVDNQAAVQRIAALQPHVLLDITVRSR
jgi:hypothetical protein